MSRLGFTSKSNHLMVCQEGILGRFHWCKQYHLSASILPHRNTFCLKSVRNEHQLRMSAYKISIIPKLDLPGSYFGCVTISATNMNKCSL